MNEKHIEFFNELKELLKKYGANIAWNNEFLFITFKGSKPFYQSCNPLYVNNDFGDTFQSIELVTTERVFK